MALPDNVDTCLVTGMFVYADGSTPTGTVEFRPTPCHVADASNLPPYTIVAAPTVVPLGPTGEIAQSLMATDDTDLNPYDWTYEVRIRLDRAAWSFNMYAPADETIDLSTVNPVACHAGMAIVVGPPGPAGEAGQGIAAGGTTGEVLAKLSDDDYDTTWVSASAPGLHADTHSEGSTDPVAVTQAQVTGLVTALAGKVTDGGGVATIRALSQAAYDALTPDPETLYLIV